MISMSCSCSMVLQQEVSLEIRLHQQIAGGVTQTVFPRTEKALSESRNQKALAFVKTDSDPEIYWSAMDWFFCGVFPHERPNCFAYYRDKGGSLDEIRSKKEIEFYDRVLLGVLKKAMEAFENDEARRWADLAREAKEALCER